jgi:hypothetical protein
MTIHRNQIARANRHVSSRRTCKKIRRREDRYWTEVRYPVVVRINREEIDFGRYKAVDIDAIVKQFTADQIAALHEKLPRGIPLNGHGQVAPQAQDRP